MHLYIALASYVRKNLETQKGVAALCAATPFWVYALTKMVIAIQQWFIALLQHLQMSCHTYQKL